MKTQAIKTILISIGTAILSGIICSHIHIGTYEQIPSSRKLGHLYFEIGVGVVLSEWGDGVDLLAEDLNHAYVNYSHTNGTKGDIIHTIYMLDPAKAEKDEILWRMDFNERRVFIDE